MMPDGNPRPYRNTSERYGRIAISLHWFIAALVAALLAVGTLMVNLPIGHDWSFPLFQWHKSLGILVFLTICVRLIWRHINPQPQLPEEMPLWERWLARATHLAFYAILFVMPLSGWAIVSTSPYNIPTYFLGLIELPPLPYLSSHPDKLIWNERLSEFHEIAAWLLGILILAHVAAAIRHHVVKKDGILRRMAPWISEKTL